MLREARLANHYGLPANLALTAVTSVPASSLGISHRLGLLTEGSDADAVLWTSHPLQLGSRPVQVWIDGIPQIQTSSGLSEVGPDP